MIKKIYCLKVIDFYFENLATEASNMGLRIMAYGGIYISGNIIN
jgi:glucokinase